MPKTPPNDKNNKNGKKRMERMDTKNAQVPLCRPLQIFFVLPENTQLSTQVYR